MATCRVCGEAGHLAAKCDELYPPPDTMYTGEGCSADQGDGEEESISVLLYVVEEALEALRAVQQGLILLES
jgi:hypothetical protein